MILYVSTAELHKITMNQWEAPFVGLMANATHAVHLILYRDFSPVEFSKKSEFQNFDSNRIEPGSKSAKKCQSKSINFSLFFSKMSKKIVTRELILYLK